MINVATIVMLMLICDIDVQQFHSCRLMLFRLICLLDNYELIRKQGPKIRSFTNSGPKVLSIASQLIIAPAVNY